MEWQDGVGNVVVVKADKTPLSVQELTAFTDYIWEILSTCDPCFEEEDYGVGMGDESDPRRYYKPGRLAEYMKDYPKSRNPDVDFSCI